MPYLGGICRGRKAVKGIKLKGEGLPP
jgi:hypothetical protein